MRALATVLDDQDLCKELPLAAYNSVGWQKRHAAFFIYLW